MLRVSHFPLGSRTLRLAFPPMRGSDVWLIQRWLNRSFSLVPNWGAMKIPEDGLMSGQTLLAIRRLATRLSIWQPYEVTAFTYNLFGQTVERRTGTEQPFGFRSLVMGDEGQDVLVLQNRLAAANRRLALIIGRPADGFYDARTARAVRVFQREAAYFAEFAIPVTGQVLGDTFLTILDRTMLGGRELSIGSRGIDVLLLQELLLGMGYYTTMDGIFASSTYQAVTDWQSDHNLPASGSFGPHEYWRIGLERGY